MELHSAHLCNALQAHLQGLNWKNVALVRHCLHLNAVAFLCLLSFTFCDDWCDAELQLLVACCQDGAYTAARCLQRALRHHIVVLYHASQGRGPLGGGPLWRKGGDGGGVNGGEGGGGETQERRLLGPRWQNKKDQEHRKAVEQFGHLHHFDKELSSRHCKRKQKKPLSELRFSN